MTVGLVGFGCVGQGIFHIITHGSLRSHFVVKRILVKEATKKRSEDLRYFTTDINSVLDDEEIDIIVEATDDARFAFDLALGALQRGKFVVTANKKMVAEHMRELLELQRIYKRPVMYEAAVCGSVPIIKILDTFYSTDPVISLEGVVNGTTNYILTKIFSSNNNFHEAFQAAIDRGFTERDSNADISGLDAKYKLSILLFHAFGVTIKPQEIVAFGIDRISNEDVVYAKKIGCVIKLVAGVYTVNSKLCALIAPKFVHPDSHLGSTDNEFNTVVIEGRYSSKQFFCGKGAGRLPTGAAIASDLNAILNHSYIYQDNKFQENEWSYTTEACVEVYIRTSDSPANFSLIESQFPCEGYASTHGNYIIGKMKVSKLNEIHADKNASLVLLPSSTIAFASIEELAIEQRK